MAARLASASTAFSIAAASKGHPLEPLYNNPGGNRPSMLFWNRNTLARTETELNGMAWPLRSTFFLILASN
jgi:hypothetical protein